MRIAESIRAKKEIELLGGTYRYTPNFKRKADFIEYFEKVTREKKFIKPYLNTLKHLKIFTKGKIKFSHIDEKWFEDFKNYLSKSLAPNSVYTYLATIKAAINKAEKEKIINDNRTRFFSNIKRPDVQRIYLTFDEIVKLQKVKCQNGDIKRAFLFSCYTGLRYSDLKKLTWNQIKKVNDRYTLEFRQKKTGNFEYFPLSKMAFEILVKDLDIIPIATNSKVFKIPDNSNYNRVLKVLAKKAGIEKDLSSHIGRHTFATLGLTQGIDIYTISKLLGHKSLTQTQIYAKIVDSQKAKAVDMLPSFEISSL
jgi:integrase